MESNYTTVFKTETEVIPSSSMVEDTSNVQGQFPYGIFGPYNVALNAFVPGMFLIARDIKKGGGAKAYTIFKTVDDVESCVMSVPEQDRNFYEILVADGNNCAPVKQVFDIDINENFDEELKEALISTLFDSYNKCVKTLGFSVDQDDVVVLESSGEVKKDDGTIGYKTSMHVKFNGHHFSSVTELNKIRTTVLSELFDDPDLKDYIDNKIYTKNRLMRMPLCTKISNIPRTLKIFSGHSFKESLCTYISEDSVLVNIQDKKVEKKKNKLDNSQLSTDDDGVLLMFDDNEPILENRERLFLDNIDKFRVEYNCDNYNDWVSIGIMLYTADLDVTCFHEFSKISPKYDYMKVEKKWKTFQRYDKSILRFISLLKKNNIKYDLHDPLTNKNVTPIKLLYSSYCTKVAEYFGVVYGDIVKFDNENFYVFQKRWKLCNKKNTEISTIIRNMFIPDIMKQVNDLQCNLKNVSEETDKTLHLRINAHIDMLLKVRKDMDFGLLPKMVSMFSSALFDDGFARRLDADTYLIGFENGYYDLRTRVFAELTSNIMVTKSVGYDFPLECPYRDEIEEFLKQIYPDDEIRHFQKKFFGSILCGKNRDEIMCFWVGGGSKITGANGKGVCSSILKKTLGVENGYFLTGSNAIITSHQDDEKSANSALFKFKDKRVIEFQEIEKMVNMGKMKSLTGNDDITARDLYRSNETFSPTWNLVVCMNKPPELSMIDGGTQRRVRIIPHQSKFVDDVNDPKWFGMKNIYQKDNSLKEKIADWGPSFMYLLLEWYYDLYLPEGLGYDVTPECIKVATEEVFEDHDSELIAYLVNNIFEVETPNCNQDSEKLPPFIYVHVIQKNISTLSKKYNSKELEEILTDQYGNDFKKQWDRRKRDVNGKKITQDEFRVYKNVLLNHRWSENA